MAHSRPVPAENNIIGSCDWKAKDMERFSSGMYLLRGRHSQGSVMDTTRGQATRLIR